MLDYLGRMGHLLGYNPISRAEIAELVAEKEARDASNLWLENGAIEENNENDVQ